MHWLWLTNCICVNTKIMVHVFLLLVYLGTGDERRLASGDMYFRNIQVCNYFASELSKRYGNYGSIDWMDNRDKVTAYCVPKYIKEDTFGVNLYD